MNKPERVKNHEIIDKLASVTALSEVNIMVFF